MNTLGPVFIQKIFLRAYGEVLYFTKFKDEIKTKIIS